VLRLLRRRAGPHGRIHRRHRRRPDDHTDHRRRPRPHRRRGPLMSTITSTTPETEGPAGQRIDLAIEGMTCASCAARIERRLNKLDGVTATVNYATEQAQVTFPEGTEPAELVAEVEAAGYTAHLPATATETAGAGAGEERDDPTRRLRDRLAISTALTIPVLLLSMVPA